MVEASSDAEGLVPTEAELRAFVVTNGDRYWRRWGWYIQKRTRRAGTLWPPFFFNFVWFLYRRIYRELWVIVALGVVASGIEVAILVAQDDSPYRSYKEMEYLVNIGLAFATSWLGSFFYLRKFRAAVAAARAEGLTPEATLQLLAEKGGTNSIAAAIGAVVAALLVLIGLATG